MTIEINSKIIQRRSDPPKNDDDIESLDRNIQQLETARNEKAGQLEAKQEELAAAAKNLRDAQNSAVKSSLDVVKGSLDTTSAALSAALKAGTEAATAVSEAATAVSIVGGAVGIAGGVVGGYLAYQGFRKAQAEGEGAAKTKVAAEKKLGQLGDDDADLRRPANERVKLKAEMNETKATWNKVISAVKMVGAALSIVAGGLAIAAALGTPVGWAVVGVAIAAAVVGMAASGATIGYSAYRHHTSQAEKAELASNVNTLKNATEEIRDNIGNDQEIRRVLDRTIAELEKSPRAAEANGPLSQPDRACGADCRRPTPIGHLQKPIRSRAWRTRPGRPTSNCWRATNIS